MGNPDEKFPGVDVIKAKAARPGPRKKGGPPLKQLTAEELAAMPPSVRARYERRRTAKSMGSDASALVLGTRQNKLTIELVDVIVRVMRRTGAPIRHVAQSIGIPPTTLDEWIHRGEDPRQRDTPYALLADAVTRARFENRVSLYEKLNTGGKGWMAAAWLAERLMPSELGPATKRIEHSGTGIGGAIRITGGVELPCEIPDGHPSLKASGAPSLTPARATNGAANGHASLNGHAVPILAEGVSLPPEEDPD